MSVQIPHQFELVWTQALPTVEGKYFILWPQDKEPTVQTICLDDLGPYYTDSDYSVTHFPEADGFWFMGPIPYPELPIGFIPLEEGR